jgi:hypothetical protein
MPDQNDRSLVRRPSGQVTKLSPGGQQIVSGMIDDTLELARGRQELSTEKRYKIGEQELCEPDYLQVLEWAKQVKMEPQECLHVLRFGPRRLRNNTIEYSQIFDGKFESIWWDCILTNSEDLFCKEDVWSKSLFKVFSCTQPLELKELHLSGIQKLSITSTLFKLNKLSIHSNSEVNLTNLSFCPNLKRLDSGVPFLGLDTVVRMLLNNFGRYRGKQGRQLDLSLVPKLSVMDCSNFGLEKLDLTDLPNLKELDCSGNNLRNIDLSNLPKLRRLVFKDTNIKNIDLSGVPLLEELYCPDASQIAELDISRLKGLKTLKFDNLAYRNHLNKLHEQLTEDLAGFLLGQKIGFEIINSKNKNIIIPKNRKITKTLLRKLVRDHQDVYAPPIPVYTVWERIMDKIKDLKKQIETDKQKFKKRPKIIKRDDQNF